MERYNFKTIEKKWQEEWDNNGAREYWAEIRTTPPMVKDTQLLVDEVLGY